MKTTITLLTITAIIMAVGSTAMATLTGNPEADGWSFQGNSLENGTYAKGGANIGFDIYTTKFTVSDGTDFAIGSPTSGYYGSFDPGTARAWSAGDVIVGVGGVFNDITAAQAGWDSFTGSMTDVQADSKLRLQAKFGPSSVWKPSTVAPGNGDGEKSSGDGVEYIRTSGYLHLGNYWQVHAGEIMGVQDTDHVDNGAADIARLIWTWDAENNRPGSWQILMNATLGGYDTDLGDLVISSVQYDSPYTDGVAIIVPEPATMALLGLGGLALIRKRKHA